MAKRNYEVIHPKLIRVTADSVGVRVALPVGSVISLEEDVGKRMMASGKVKSTTLAKKVDVVDGEAQAQVKAEAEAEAKAKAKAAKAAKK